MSALPRGAANAAVQLVLSRLSGVEKIARGWRALCPVHPDHTPSLEVANGDNGGAVLLCRAGCDTGDVLRALGLGWTDIGPPGAAATNGHGAGHGRVVPITRDSFVATYVYVDEHGAPLFRVCRKRLTTGKKEFPQQHPDPDRPGEWKWGRGDARRVLYRLPELIEGVALGKVVYVVEGEKDAERLASLGYVATTAPEGAGKWRPEYGAHLADADVVILPDNDDAGRNHAEDVARSAEMAGAARVRVVTLPGLPEKGDVSDWLDAGHAGAELDALVAAALPRGAIAVEGDEAEDVTGVRRPPPTPALDEPMFYGLAGDVVRAVLPETEADPVGLLVHLLVAFGNALNRTPHYMVGATTHAFNLFGLIVGATNVGRKGTSWEWPKRLMKAADPLWEQQCVLGGLSSGEGLIARLKDEPDDEKGQGVAKRSDRRLLCLESEFGLVMRRMAREGNTLSGVLRQAWDGATLGTITKQSVTATDTHVSVIGHVTPGELTALLDKKDVAGGLVNRFLIVYVRRSKFLPDGGDIRRVPLDALGSRLGRALTTGRRIGQLWRDDGASARWRALYPGLSTPRPGLMGEVTSRGAAIVLRLAGLYALLDETREIRAEHLDAAVSLWRYAEASCAYVFGDSLGDANADRLLAALREAPDGMDRSAIRDLFKRNLPRDRMNALLSLLVQNELVESRTEKTRGRAREVWMIRRWSPPDPDDPTSSRSSESSTSSKSFTNFSAESAEERDAHAREEKSTNVFDDSDDLARQKGGGSPERESSSSSSLLLSVGDAPPSGACGRNGVHGHPFPDAPGGCV